MNDFKVLSNTKSTFVKKLYIGATDAKILMYNPTLEEIKASGNFYATEEPVYDKENGYTHVFYLESELNEEKIYSKLNIWVSKKPFISERTGKAEFIDKFGRTAWLEVTAKGKPINNDSKYFDFESALPHHMGLKYLVELLYVVSGYGKANGAVRRENLKIEQDNEIAKLQDEKAVLKDLLEYHILPLNLKKLLSGDNTEIKGIVQSIIEANNKVKVMLGVEDGKYQKVYEKKFTDPGGLQPTATSLNSAKILVEDKQLGINATNAYNQSTGKEGPYYPTVNVVLREFDPDLVSTTETTLTDKIPNKFPAFGKLPKPNLK